MAGSVIRIMIHYQQLPLWQLQVLRIDFQEWMTSLALSSLKMMKKMRAREKWITKSIKSVNWQDQIKIHKTVTLIINGKEVFVKVIKQIIWVEVVKTDGGSEMNEDSN